MKKLIPAVVGAFLMMSSMSGTQAALLGSVVDILNNMDEQKLCKATMGAIEPIKSAAGSVGGGVASSVGGGVASSVGCRCPEGSRFHAPSGGCVKPGVGRLDAPGSSSAPAKRQN
jgi:hypothetical protein